MADGGQKEQLLRLIDRMLELGGEDVIAWEWIWMGRSPVILPLNNLMVPLFMEEYLKAHGINTEIIDKPFLITLIIFSVQSFNVNV